MVDDVTLFEQIVARTRRELAALPPDRRNWLSRQVEKIALLQTELDRLFCIVGGPKICTECLGGCCSRAKHHLTLTNIIAYLLGDEEPPQPDFSLSCPMLAPYGCRLPVARRPFNCIIFLCEEIDRELTAEQREAFTRVEFELRKAYLEVAESCPGTSLRGLLIAADRIGERPLLTNQ